MDRSNLPADENLPEVVPDQSPQALPKEAALQYETQLGEKDPKYPVLLDDAPKLPSEYAPTPGVTAAAVPSSVSPDTIPWETRSPETAEQGLAGRSPTDPPAPEEKKILGLKKKVFFIVVVLVLVILAAALGGGLGGGLSKKNKNNAEGAEDGTGDTPTSTTSDPSSTASQTSSAPTPSETFLNNQTVPVERFAFQAFSGVNFTGKVSEVYRREGFYNFGFDAFSYVWLPNNTNCCVTFCANTTKGVGYWCEQRYRNVSSDSFPRLAINCGNDVRKVMPCS